LYVTFAIVAALVVDIELSNISDLITVELSSSSGILIFIVIAFAYTIGQFSIIHFSKMAAKTTISRNNYLLWATKTVTYGQYLLILFFVIIILQIIFLERYNSTILILAIAMSNGLGIFTMIVLAQRLLSYFKWEKDLIVLTYGISAIIVAITALVTTMFMGGVLLTKPLSVYPGSETAFPSFDPNSLTSLLNYIYYILAIVSFISIWVGTLLLMNQYSRVMGNRRRILSVTALILGFYLSQVLIIYLSPYFIFNQDDLASFLFYYRVTFAISSTVGGILFGIPFLQIAQKFSRSPTVRNYAIISASGLILFFVSGSATVYQTPYPPFGLATVSLIGLSSYLVLLGIYSLAISVSEDERLRRFTLKTAKEFKFLHSMGMAEQGQEIEKRITTFKDHIVEDTGVEPSLNEEDMKQYLYRTLEEVQKKKLKPE
jgi:hypothetical protein